MVVQTEENRARHDGPEGLRCIPVGHGLTDPLVWSHGVVVGNVTRQNLPELPLPNNDKPVQRLTPERADETLDMGVHVWRCNRGGDAGDIVGVVGSETKDGIVVVDEMDGTRDGIAQLNELLTQEGHRGRASDGMMHDTPSLVSDNDQDVEAFSEDGIDGEKVHGEERVDMRSEKSAPGEGGANPALTAEVCEDTTDGGLGDMDIELAQFTMDLSDSPHAIIVLEAENEVLNLSGSTRTPTGRFVGEGPESCSENPRPRKDGLGLDDGEHGGCPPARRNECGEDRAVALQDTRTGACEAEGPSEDIAFRDEDSVLYEENLRVVRMTGNEEADEVEQHGEQGILRDRTEWAYDNRSRQSMMDTEIRYHAIWRDTA